MKLVDFCIRLCSRRHKYEFGFWFMSECFANRTIFHYVVNNFTNLTSVAVNNLPLTIYILLAQHVTCTRINVNFRHWNACKLMFTGTHIWECRLILLSV